MIQRRYQRVLFGCILLFAFAYFLPSFSPSFVSDSGVSDAGRLPSETNDESKSKEGWRPEEKELVVASLKGDDTSWLDDFFASWKKNIYIVNDPSAPLTVTKNKGREAMPFLTYETNFFNNLHSALLLCLNSQ